MCKPSFHKRRVVRPDPEFARQLRVFFHQMRNVSKEIDVTLILAEKIPGTINNNFLTVTIKGFVHAEELAIGRCSISSGSNDFQIDILMNIDSLQEY